MTKDEALWMALGVLEFYYDLYKEKVDANAITAIKEVLAQPEQEFFVVKHYSADERPTIKGNGFDGLEVGTDREDAEKFIKWVNARISTPPQPKPEQESDDLTIAYMAGLYDGKNTLHPKPEQEPVTLQINSIPPFKNPPNDVIDAAFHVSNWAQRNNWTKWRIGKCCSVDYTTPPRREWVGLTEEERDHFEGLHLYAARNQVEAWIEGVPAFIDAIEAKLREKNTYTTPPQRKPLPPQSPCEMTQAEGKMFKLGWLECEAAHGIKGE